MAEQFGSADDVRNAVFLLGESFICEGEEAEARSCFDRIQDQYPGTPYLTELLLAVDVRELINLRA
jgi:TolA-binding protein